VKSTIVLLLVIALISPFYASAGFITVIGDVNADERPNTQLYENLLDSSDNVLFSRLRYLGVDGIANLYYQLNVESVVIGSSTITQDILADVDLLVFNQFRRNNTLYYSEDELNVINSFVKGGGNLIVVAETQFDRHYDNINTFLSGVGSSIRFDGFSVESAIANAAKHPFTQDIATLAVSSFNILTGGSALYTTSNGHTVVATEQIGGPALANAAFSISTASNGSAATSLPSPSGLWLLLLVLPLMFTHKERSK
jgi:hypothetical protein